MLLSAASARRVSALTPLAVPLDVVETAGVDRRAFPAAGSVPFARGRVRDPGAVHLTGPDGAPARAQGTVLERWRDGSVRWLLLDFLADVPAGRRVVYTLRDGPPPDAAGAPHVAVADGGRTLDTGAVRVRLGGDGALVRVETGDASVPVALAPVTIDGRSDATSARSAVTIETRGPVRTEALVTGRVAPGLEYEARVAAFAGRRFVRIRLTVTDVADEPFLPLRSLALEAGGPFVRAAFGLDGRSERFPSLDRAHELVQPDADAFRLDGAAAGRRADGWARAVGDHAITTVVAPDFWREYPKALAIEQARVRLDLFAGRDAPVQFGTGAAKTHEVWIAVEPPDGATPPRELAAALGAPLVALPPAEWIVASGALPQALAPSARGASDFLGRVADAFQRYRRDADKARWDDGPPVACEARTSEHPRTGFYGVFNWGDWNFPGYRDHTDGCDAWGNLEYDLPQVLGLAWAATGSRVFYDGMLAAARHYRDVDVIHHAPGHPDWVGLNHPHTNMHFTFGTPANVDLGHTWTEGLLTAYRLTGETRFLAAARGIADALASRVRNANNPRKFGWPMIALVAVWDATGEQRYADAAHVFATQAMPTYRPSPASADWKMGILADGLATVDAATRDPEIRRWLVAYADTLAGDPGRWPDARYALPLGYLAVATGNAEYERVAVGTSRTMSVPAWGKPLAIAGRTGFRLLGPLAARDAVTRDRAAPPPASAPAPRPPSPRRRAPGRPTAG